MVGAVSYGYWVFFVCGMFLIMFPAHILMSYIWAYTYLVRSVLVLRCGGVVSVCRLKHYWSVQVECGGWGLMTAWNRGFFLSPGFCSGMSFPSWWRDWIQYCSYGKSKFGLFRGLSRVIMLFIWLYSCWFCRMCRVYAFSNNHACHN